MIVFLLYAMAIGFGFFIGRGYKYGTLLDKLYKDILTLNTYIRICEDDGETTLTETEREQLGKCYVILDRLRPYARIK